MAKAMWKSKKYSYAMDLKACMERNIRIPQMTVAAIPQAKNTRCNWLT